jgi:hypothetical protein
MLAEHYDRLTVVRGVATNTVSHPDGTVFAATGRHLAGGRSPESSIDTLIANEFGRETLFPAISMNFPSWFVGSELDRRAMPLRAAGIETVGRSLNRSELYTYAADRAQVTTLLSQEARDLAARQQFPEVFNGMGLHYDALHRMLQGNLRANFDGAMLTAAYPNLVPTAVGERYRFFQTGAINAAFAVEAMKRNIMRSVAFSVGSFDTHSTNYRNQAALQQDLFNLLARLIRTLEAPESRHPTLMGERLIDHTHIMVVSEFCRTPQINVNGGRDHYPCGATLLISPRFRGNFSIGSSDPDQMLPVASRMFSDGRRAIAPPDILATFLTAFGVNPRRYMRDGESVPRCSARRRSPRLTAGGRAGCDPRGGQSPSCVPFARCSRCWRSSARPSPRGSRPRTAATSARAAAPPRAATTASTRAPRPGRTASAASAAAAASVAPRAAPRR